MSYKRITPEQLKEYENRKLTSKEIIEMEQRGFKIPLIVKLSTLEEGKIAFSLDMVKNMLEFAVGREYYEKASILRDFIKIKNK
tara:strand:- start:1104 stop:1355 length:252 start_codon:yes stop_codon:yes gene_type:complete